MILIKGGQSWKIIYNTGYEHSVNKPVNHLHDIDLYCL